MTFNKKLRQVTVRTAKTWTGKSHRGAMKKVTKSVQKKVKFIHHKKPKL